MTRALLVLLAALLLTGPAAAHSQSFGFLTVTAHADRAAGRLELAVRDADLLFGLDGDGNGEVTWGETESREGDIARGMMAGIGLARGGDACRLAPDPLLVDSHGGEAYLVLPFEGLCAGQGPLSIAYDLMFDRDAQHRGIVSVSDTGAEPASFVMSPDSRHVSLAAGDSVLQNLASYVVHGVHHIWTGYDHMLFLITLLLSATLSSRGLGRRKEFLEATKLVTAFTASHSLTLGLAAAHIIAIPPQITESLIALTIVLAAINNIWPILTARAWLLALSFGLVHGLGFASVLTDLGLPERSLLPALLAFNAGVEIGQLAIVAAVLPVIHAVVQWKPGYRAMPVANAAIIAVGLAWLSDRVLGTGLMPF